MLIIKKEEYNHAFLIHFNIFHTIKKALNSSAFILKFTPVGILNIYIPSNIW